MSRFFSNVSSMLVVRGVLSILFGIVALAWPGITLTALVALFGAFALVDGIIALVSAIRNTATPFPRWVVALDGVAGIAAGLLTFFFPAATALALLYIIAVWALVTGSLLLGAAVTGPRFEPGWLMALDGVVSILFGIALIAWPGSGILAIVWALGLYTVVVGVWSLVAAYRVHRDATALKASPVGHLFGGSAA
jgi:uncharacterized membrane protein HdeD (DUF308 family)